MLENKTVIVTGGSRGIGEDICLAFAKEKANVVVNYSKSSPDFLLDKLKSYGVQAISIQGNVADFNDAKNIILQAKKTFGTIDVLVNNAGITKDNLIISMKEDEFDQVIDVNLKGTFNMMKHVTKVMLKQKNGAIINISSVVGILGNTGQVNYSASKAGVIGMTKSLAREIASRGITVNAIAPGFIKTDMTKKLNDKTIQLALNNIPLNRMGEKEDVSRVAIFLAQNKYITGQVISVDGGMSM